MKNIICNCIFGKHIISTDEEYEEIIKDIKSSLNQK